MSTRSSIIIIALLLVITLASGLVIGNLLPDKVASHWDAQGQVNGYSSKTFATFFVPGMEVFLLLLFLGLPLIDPRKENIRKFRPYYNLFIVFIIGFMTYMYILTLAWNLGVKFELLRLMAPAYAGLLFFSGVLLTKAQPNWFIGIRTAWTLSDNRVWAKTHEVGGTVFKVCGVVCLLGVVFPAQAIWFLVVPILSGSVGLIVYSYLYYRSLHQGEA